MSAAGNYPMSFAKQASVGRVAIISPPPAFEQITLQPTAESVSVRQAQNIFGAKSAPLEHTHRKESS
jgi:hypothetical protein